MKLKRGDLFIFGMLGQLWLVKQVKGELRAYIVSNDSGWGYWEGAKEIEAIIDINEFELVGNIYESRSRKNKAEMGKS